MRLTAHRFGIVDRAVIGWLCLEVYGPADIQSGPDALTGRNAIPQSLAKVRAILPGSASPLIIVCRVPPSIFRPRSEFDQVAFGNKYLGLPVPVQVYDARHTSSVSDAFSPIIKAVDRISEILR